MKIQHILFLKIFFAHILTAQNVGISDASSFSPGSLLHVNKSIGADALLEVIRLERTNATIGTNQGANISSFLNGTEMARIQWNPTGGTLNNSNLSFFTRSGGAINSTPSIFIENNGNVGIGTTTTGNGKLNINGTVAIGTNGTHYTLPSARGNANQVLKTNANGEVTWQNDGFSNLNISCRRAINQSITVLNQTVKPGTDLYSVGTDITYNATTGIYTLSPGTYELDAFGNPPSVNGFGAYAYLEWWDESSNASLNSQQIYLRGAPVVPDNLRSYTIINVTSNTNVSLKCTTVSSGANANITMTIKKLN